MSAVKDENFIAIQGWMLNKLNLKGNELIVYAVIYGFSQDDESRFTGSRRYLAEWCGCTLKTVDNALSSLVAKGLIAKHDKTINGVHLCDYSITQVGKNLQQGTVKITQGVGKNLQQGTVKITHHNIEDNLGIDTLEDNIDKPKRKRFAAASLDDKGTYGQIVDYLNAKAGTRYKASTASTHRLIKARLNEGFTLEDFKTVIDKKCAEWLTNSKMEQYLRPETLFGTKFEGYLNAKPQRAQQANMLPPERRETQAEQNKVIELMSQLKA